MDLRTFFPMPHTSRGGAAAHNGFKTEIILYQQLQTLVYRGEPLTLSDPAGADKDAHDLEVVAPIQFAIESKSEGAFEGGGNTMRFVDGQFQLPEKELFNYLVSINVTLPLWEGRVPSFKTGDKTEATWLAEVDSFPPYYFDIDPLAVARYYKKKGTHYIWVQGRGLYHTGEDILGWGVPLFELPCTLRIRLKQHGSGSVPSDCQASLNFKQRKLPPSPYDFLDVTRLPPGFAPKPVE